MTGRTARITWNAPPQVDVDHAPGDSEVDFLDAARGTDARAVHYDIDAADLVDDATDDRVYCVRIGDIEFDDADIAGGDVSQCPRA
jgi:hypothetical protein